MINLKNLLFLVIAIPTITFAQEPSTFTLEGTSPEGLKKVYLLSYEYNTDELKVDSTTVQDGKFTFQGPLAGTSYSGLYFRSDFNVETSAKIPDYWFFLIPGKTIVDGTGERAKIVDGSKGVKEYLLFQEELGANREAFRSKGYSEYDERIDSLQMEMEKIFEEREAKYGSLETFIMEGQIEFIKKHPASSYSLVLLEGIAENEGMVETVKPLFNALDPHIKNSERAKRLSIKVNSIKLKEGVKALEFQQTDVDGKILKLSDYKGKYVLLDFWASWCVPCRHENPNLVKAYNRFKDKNFEILGISLDADKQSWLKAIADDKLEWKQVSDLKGWKNEVAVLYGINAVLSNFLLDPEGNIIARDLRGKDLEEALVRFLDK